MTYSGELNEMSNSEKGDSQLNKPIPIHQWTNGGDEVFVLRFADKDGKSYGDFQHPMTVGEVVTEPHWNPQPVCGGGIHGWAWGSGMGDGKDPDWSALWQVYGVRPEEIVAGVDGGPKIKFRTGTLRYKGDWHGAAMFIMSGQMAWTFHNSCGSASSSGYSGSASSSGSYGSASSTHSGTAAIVTGLDGRAKAAEFGCIALAWWNTKAERVEMRCAQVGTAKRRKDGELKPDTWYCLNAAGRFVEAKG
jgi:hypothetical protein